MDGLALLCNLFADGPVTLKRLRIAGVATLGELERTQPAKLAEWLHASLPQATAFANEARKLARRLAEEARPAPLPERATPARIPEVHRAPSPSAPPPRLALPAPGAAPAAAEPLRAGLLPGLDDSLCARLALHHVRTVQALSELAGLALARRTGIPYSTLLELSRAARRLATERARDARVAQRAADAPRAEAARDLREHELRPLAAPAHAAHAPAPPRRPAESELVRSDEFTLPLAEPDSAGPFG